MNKMWLIVVELVFDFIMVMVVITNVKDAVLFVIVVVVSVCIPAESVIICIVTAAALSKST